MELIIGLLSGAVGGNVAGKLLGSLNQGTLINSIAGVVGGGLGGTLLGMIGAPDLAGAAGGAGAWISGPSSVKSQAVVSAVVSCWRSLALCVRRWPSKHHQSKR